MNLERKTWIYSTAWEADGGGLGPGRFCDRQANFSAKRLMYDNNPGVESFD